MYINISEFKLQNSEAIEDVYRCYQLDYTEFLGQLYSTGNTLNAKIRFALNPTLSRNPYLSDFYESFCIAWVLSDKYLNKTQKLKVVVENTLQKEIFNAVLKQRIPFYTPVVNTSSSTVFLQSSTLFFIFSSVLKYLYVSLCGIIYSIGKNKHVLPQGAKLILVDTFILKSQIKNGMYFNRYQTRQFMENLSKQSEDNVYLLPEIEARAFSKKTMDVLSKSGNQFIFKHDYLKLNDYLKFFYHAFKPPSQIIGSPYFKGINLKKAILINNKNLRIPFLVDAVNFYFLKRLKESGIKVTMYVDWWENQSIDKITHLGLASLYPDCKRVGLVNYMIDMNYNYYIIPAKWEKVASLTPLIFWTSSEYLADKLSTYCSEISFKIDKYTRFNILPEGKVKHPQYLLFVLPMQENESNFILKTLVDMLSLSCTGFKIKVKPHPAGTPIDKYRTILEKAGIEFTSSELIDLYERAKIVISSASSACVEALLNEIPLIILSNSPYFQNPIPDIAGNTMYQKARNTDMLMSSIDQFSAKNFLFNRIISSQLRKLVL